MKTKRESFRHLLEAAIAHSDCKRRSWIFLARSDFWWEKSRGGSLRKFTSMWVVGLSALTTFASIAGFILPCFQHGECNGTVATGGWSWREKHAPPRYPITLSSSFFNCWTSSSPPCTDSLCTFPSSLSFLSNLLSNCSQTLIHLATLVDALSYLGVAC